LFKLKASKCFTGHGVNSGHQTLNDAKLVIDNLKEAKIISL
jgi:hypothetical protein